MSALFGTVLVAGTIIFICTVYVIVDLWIERKYKSSYDWQQDLSSKAMITEWRPDQRGGGDQYITLLKKSPEELNDERHA